MNQTLISALWITLIGMGLVFIAILLLWGLMALLVRATARSAETEEARGDAEDEAEDTPLINNGTDRKRQAAALAVAVALAGQSTPAASLVSPAHEGLSAWQSTHRANQISRNAGMIAQRRGPTCKD
jgi:Na+-transporting methylmalonyl-CoA/oxaloacetate decarboxylase gamma subunit